jgi:hypothetical protein
MNNCKWIVFSQRSGLVAKAQKVDSMETAAGKSLALQDYKAELKDVTKYLSGHWNEKKVGLNTKSGSPLFTKNPGKFFSRWGLDSKGKTYLLEKFVRGNHSEEDLARMSDPKCSAVAMLMEFVKLWRYGAQGAMVVQGSGGTWSPKKTADGIVSRMKDLEANGLPSDTAPADTPKVYNDEENESIMAALTGGQATSSSQDDPLAGYDA